MLSQEIRRGFLNYFKKESHIIVPSAPVVPHDDPTLLFINAGMCQFKDLFLGKTKRDYTRATSTQKCIRVGGKHNDFENVGHTSRHCTFFEMLGNFSFGDYFKEEAIKFAWEVTTNIFGFDPDRIWPSVFKDDDEAFALWEKHVPQKRIVRFDEKENFWSMGDTGPCGPCSELLYDRGEKYGDAKSPYEDYSGERYLEFWNLVFMQYSRDDKGIMTPLPKQSIDTGAGLERVVALKMGVDCVFSTDILRSLISEMENISKIKYDEHNKKLAPCFHVIADHIRCLSFAIADGAQPSNTDRGYILRKILRRAVRYGKMLNMEKPFLSRLVPRLIEIMGDDFPDIVSAKDRICDILQLEEESFFKTLKRGGNLLSQIIEKSKGTISGNDAFKLKDTYGFPIEEILLIAKDENLKVDINKYNDLEQGAKEKSRKARNVQSSINETNDQLFQDILANNKPSNFVGFDNIQTKAKILAIISNDNLVDKIEENQKAIIILDNTPFYPEKGGQVGDMGKIYLSTDESITFFVEDTKTPTNGIIAHIGTLKKGQLKTNDEVVAIIDSKRRSEIENNHTSTHLLHWALQKVLGDQIKQAGSLVESNYFRLDFNHHKQISLKELREVESLVNEKIRTNEKINTYEKSLEDIQKEKSVKMFFGEKYGSVVRVVDIDFSKELCGGCHVDTLGEIGFFKIIKESSIAAGVRRIEATTGKYAEEKIYNDEDLIFDLSDLLKSNKPKIKSALVNLIDENKLQKENLKKLNQARINSLADESSKKAQKINDFSVFISEVDIPSQDMVLFSDILSNKLKNSFIAIATKNNDRLAFLIKICPELVEKGLFANEIIKAISPIIKGGGGGKKEIAQAGGKDISKINEAIEKIRQIVKEKC
jgi:alanyl-tRNA synthetase